MYGKRLSAADVVLTQFKKKKFFFVLLENKCTEMKTFLSFCLVPLAFEYFVCVSHSRFFLNVEVHSKL